jgi:hypothetical protein
VSHNIKFYLHLQKKIIIIITDHFFFHFFNMDLASELLKRELKLDELCRSTAENDPNYAHYHLERSRLNMLQAQYTLNQVLLHQGMDPCVIQQANQRLEECRLEYRTGTQLQQLQQNPTVISIPMMNSTSNAPMEVAETKTNEQRIHHTSKASSLPTKKTYHGSKVIPWKMKQMKQAIDELNGLKYFTSKPECIKCLLLAIPKASNEQIKAACIALNVESNGDSPTNIRAQILKQTQDYFDTIPQSHRFTERVKQCTTAQELTEYDLKMELRARDGRNNKGNSSSKLSQSAVGGGGHVSMEEEDDEAKSDDVASIHSSESNSSSSTISSVVNDDDGIASTPTPAAEKAPVVNVVSNASTTNKRHHHQQGKNHSNKRHKNT